MNQLVFKPYFSNSFRRRGVPTSPAHTPRWMSDGESAPPYDPIHPATASMSTPMVAKISVATVTSRQSPVSAFLSAADPEPERRAGWIDRADPAASGSSGDDHAHPSVSTLRVPHRIETGETAGI